jgi:mannobiose 2-epimerase
VEPREKILFEILYQLKENLLDKWYPKVLDYDDGGFYSNLTHDFELEKNQDKMIVTQARHIWTLSKAAAIYNEENYHVYASHGFNFLKQKMWDSNYGGFFQIRDKYGNQSDAEGWFNEKRVYGNAYGLFGLSALYKLTKKKDVIEFALEVFKWIEDSAHDKNMKGYFQFFKENNEVFGKDSDYQTNASDAIEVGFKDQNSSIHLLEAFTEFYSVYKDPLIKERLNEMLQLIRDKITTEKGYLQLFFDHDWKPVSFKDSPEELRKANYRLDHVSFGHDYETAFLMLEASHALGIENDLVTLRTAKKMVDHALDNGWDKKNGGFFDEGYYFAGDDKCSIIKETKTWWSQAEAMNIFLLMSKIFTEEEKYYQTFKNVWEYITKFLIDHDHGDWYWGGIDKEPHHKSSPKGEIWKGTYHNGRALMNCAVMLADENSEISRINKGFSKRRSEMIEFIDHWKKIAEKL